MVWGLIQIVLQPIPYDEAIQEVLSCDAALLRVVHFRLDHCCLCPNSNLAPWQSQTCTRIDNDAHWNMLDV